MLFTTLCYALTDIFLVRLFRAGFGTLEVMVYLFVVSALLLVPFAVRTLRGRTASIAALPAGCWFSVRCSCSAACF